MRETETPTLDKWQQLEGRLSGLFGCAVAEAGGHPIQMRKGRDGERLIVNVYVDGWIKGEWTKASEDGEPVHPEGRFWRPYRSRGWPLKQYRDLKRVVGKREADRMTALKTVAFIPTWNSPRTLVRHLKKHFPDLELQDDDSSLDALEGDA